MVKEGPGATAPCKSTKHVVKKEEAKKVDNFNGVSLGTVQNVTIGRNKSGQPWKKCSKKSAFHKGPAISYEKSMELKAQMQRIRERV